MFKIRLNVISMENRKGSIIANTVHQEKAQTLEISHLIAAQFDNGMINMETKVQSIRLGMQKKIFRLKSSY